MICPQCGEVTPPGPFDVRFSNPSLGFRRWAAGIDVGVLSRLLKRLGLARRS